MTWWKKDDQFWVPKAYIHITLRTPLPYITPRCAVIAQMYRELVQDELNEYSYAAEIAGLDYSLSTHSVGIDLGIAGYNDKMHVLLEKVLVCMRDLNVREDRFEINKERLQRSYRNWEFQQPYHQVGSFTRWLNSERGWINEQYSAELPHVTAADVKAFYPQMLQQCHIELLAHGNLYKEDALNFTKLVESTLRPRRLPSNQWPVRRSLMLSPGSNFVFERTLKDPANVNHCIEYTLYIGQNTDRHLRALLLLFSQCTDEPAFNVLRTNEQLGYVVFSGASVSNTWMGYRILVQSEKGPEFLEQRIDAFLENFGTTLKEMEHSRFEKLKTSLISKRLEKLKNLGQEMARFVGHMMSETYDFEQGTLQA
jgi:insulysin